MSRLLNNIVLLMMTIICTLAIYMFNVCFVAVNTFNPARGVDTQLTQFADRLANHSE